MDIFSNNKLEAPYENEFIDIIFSKENKSSESKPTNVIFSRENLKSPQKEEKS